MLSYSQLATLEAASRDRLVLNVYIDPGELDAEYRRSWRHTLAAAVVHGRKALADAPHAERSEFERAAVRLDELANGLSDDVDGARGWAAFVTADAVLHADATHRAPHTAVSWRTGIAAVDYMRLLDGDGPTIVAVIDSRGTDVYRSAGHTVEHVERINAHAHVGRAGHMGEAPQQGFHSGTRGTTLTDAAHRALEVGRERMLHDLADQLGVLAKPSGWIVLAGIRATVNDAIKRLGKAAQKRAIYVPGLTADASEVEIARAAVDARRRLESSQNLERVAELLERAASRGRAVVGLTAAADALRTGAAREVLVTAAFLDSHPVEANAVALAVLAHGARLTEMSGDAAARLDAGAGGIAATLRFPSRSGAVTVGLSSTAA